MTTSLMAIVPLTLPTGMAVVPHDKEYFKYGMKNIQIIYTKDNIPFAKHTASVETPMNDEYEKTFSWELDETLYVGLVSDYNQIANGFSTQWPNNRQINYLGGTQMIDYFTTTSWLDTLLVHETAHNYQLNVKASRVSQWLHDIFGNGMFMSPIPFIVPNVLENSFMLEGNAVLNESLHANGGRLYSGRFKVQTLLQAKAGNIKSSDVYNSKLAFPYREIHYIQGGFYNLYLAQKYGVDKVNAYFKNHSKYWFWPMLTNTSMKDSIGVTFEESLADFAQEYSKLAQNVVLAKGERIASSQFFSPLSNDNEEIFFITNESGNRAPELVVVDKKSSVVTKRRDSWVSGKVIKVDDSYYTQGSRHISPLKIYQGLFDSQAFIKDNTESKMIQGYLIDSREVYFDVASSYSQAQLYIADKFYAQVNSSVIIDKEDNLYYFKQKDKIRTLYKNKMPLYSYEGHYGIISDVDSEGRVYFVANSEFGSTLYFYENAKVKRASDADNIVEARLINDSEVLLAAINDKEYYYVKNKINQINNEPFVTQLFLDETKYEVTELQMKEHSSMDDLSDPYNSLLDMHYSGTNFLVGVGSSGVVGNIAMQFGDPLSQNTAVAYVNRDESNITIAGLGYSNSQYQLEYSVRAYGAVDKSERTATRDSGVIVGASLPFYQAGYYYGNIEANYYQDYDTIHREPLSLSVKFAKYEQFGTSMYANSLNALELYGVLEREDIIIGGKYRFKHDLVDEYYIGAEIKCSKTDKEINSNEGGVKLSNIPYTIDMDPSTISMPNLSRSIYVKSAAYGEVDFSKVFNFSAYFFTTPLSLQRESFYAKYRYYKITDFNGNNENINEVSVGLTMSTVLINNFVVPITIEYIYNDADNNDINDNSIVRLLIGASF